MIVSFPVWIISLIMTVYKSIYLHENLIFFIFNSWIISKLFWYSMQYPSTFKCNHGVSCKNNIKFHMKTWKTQENHCNRDLKKNISLRYHHLWFQIVIKRYNNKNSMTLHKETQDQYKKLKKHVQGRTTANTLRF